MRWCPLIFLLAACAHPVAPPPVAHASARKPEPVVTAEVTDTDPVPAIAPGNRCPALGLWERPASPCIVEADNPEPRWRARIETPQIRFEDNRGKMDPASLAVVDSLAALLIAHPEFDQVEIHAHTDSKASEHS